tara:strand:- start:1989 stop:3242 length:1254 start_codon:yes stop_codon:yes gene_type:complete
MPYTKNSENLIDYFLNDLSLYLKKRTIKHQTKTDTILKMLHKDILITDKYVNFLRKKNKINFEIKEIININQFEKQELLNSKFVDQSVFNYINDNIKGIFSLTTTISNLKIKIDLALFKKKEFNNLKRLEKILIHALKIIRVCNLYKTNEIVKSLDVFLFLTPILKKMPKNSIDILGPEHCNSAVTFACANSGELLIYRKEEWKKTLIHELFHSLCLDFSMSNYDKLKKKVKKLFNIDSELLISETYCEFWATIINASFCSFSFLKEKSNVEDFILYVEFSILIEKIFSLFQVVKALDFMGLKYETLIKKDKISESYRNILFKEKTNFFCYYILKFILLHHSDEFLEWCDLNNNNTLSFDTSEILFNKFYLFIEKHHKSKFLLKNFKLMEKKLLEFHKKKDKKILQTMMMTICDYNI